MVEKLKFFSKKLGGWRLKTTWSSEGHSCWKRVWNVSGSKEVRPSHKPLAVKKEKKKKKAVVVAVGNTERALAKHALDAKYKKNKK